MLILLRGITLGVSQGKTTRRPPRGLPHTWARLAGSASPPRSGSPRHPVPRRRPRAALHRLGSCALRDRRETPTRPGPPASGWTPCSSRVRRGQRGSPPSPVSCSRPSRVGHQRHGRQPHLQRLPRAVIGGVQLNGGQGRIVAPLLGRALLGTLTNVDPGRRANLLDQRRLRRGHPPRPARRSLGRPDEHALTADERKDRSCREFQEISSTVVAELGEVFSRRPGAESRGPPRRLETPPAHLRARIGREGTRAPRPSRCG